MYSVHVILESYLQLLLLLLLLLISCLLNLALSALSRARSTEAKKQHCHFVWKNNWKFVWLSDINKLALRFFMQCWLDFGIFATLQLLLLLLLSSCKNKFYKRLCVIALYVSASKQIHMCECGCECRMSPTLMGHYLNISSTHVPLEHFISLRSCLFHYYNSDVPES